MAAAALGNGTTALARLPVHFRPQSDAPVELTLLSAEHDGAAAFVLRLDARGIVLRQAGPDGSEGAVVGMLPYPPELT